MGVSFGIRIPLPRDALSSLPKMLCIRYGSCLTLFMHDPISRFAAYYAWRNIVSRDRTASNCKLHATEQPQIASFTRSNSLKLQASRDRTASSCKLREENKVSTRSAAKNPSLALVRECRTVKTRSVLYSRCGISLINFCPARLFIFPVPRRRSCPRLASVSRQHLPLNPGALFARAHS